MKMTSRFGVCWSACVLFFLTGVLPLPAESPLAEALGKEGFTAARLSRLRDENRACVVVQINGHDFNMLVDTGATTTVLSRQAARREGIQPEKLFGPVHGSSFVSDENASYARIEKMSISGVELTPGIVIIATFKFQYLMGDGFDGILGMDTLKQNNVVLGYFPFLFYFNPKQAPSFQLQSTLQSGGYRQAFIQWNAGRYELPIMVDGVKINGLIDSGARFTVINPVITRRYNIRTVMGKGLLVGTDQAVPNPRIVRPVGVQVAEVPVPVRSCLSAPLELFQDSDPSNPDAVNALLAFDVLGKLSSILDLGNGQIFVRPVAMPQSATVPASSSQRPVPVLSPTPTGGKSVIAESPKSSTSPADPAITLRPAENGTEAKSTPSASAAEGGQTTPVSSPVLP